MRRIMRIAALALPLLGGCSPGASPWGPAATDEDRAHLRVALSAWKAGRVAGLANQQPPIRFIDRDQAAGLTLTSFEIVPPPPNVNPPGIVATLMLRNRPRLPIVRHASYRVKTTNEIEIRRGD